MADGRQILATDGKWFIDASGNWDICESCCNVLEACNCTLSQLSYPRCKITLSWSSAATTRQFLGCTWSNGETKEFCPDAYVNTATKESWTVSSAGLFSPLSASGTPTPIGGGLTMRATTSSATGSLTYNPGGPTGPFVQNQQNAFVQANVGIQYYNAAADERIRLRFDKLTKYFPGVPTTTTVTPNSYEAVGADISTDTLDLSLLKAQFSGMGKPSILSEQFGQATWLNPATTETITVKWERLARADANPNILTTTTVTPNYWKASAP